MSDARPTPATLLYINRAALEYEGLRASLNEALGVLKEGVRLYESYGLIAGHDQGVAPGVWVNSARAAISKMEGRA